MGTTLFTRVRGQLVGTDGQGNRYFEKMGALRREQRRRWVLYEGEVEKPGLGQGKFRPGLRDC